jgi:sensor histidine kinase YesM
MPLSPKQRTSLLHLAIWAGFAIYEQAVLLFTTPWAFEPLPIGLNYLLNALLFYANSLLLLPHLLARRRYLAYAGAVLLLLGSYALLRSLLFLWLVPVLGLPVVPVLGSAHTFWLVSSYRGSFFLFVSIGYWFARNAVALETQKRQQEHLLRVTERNLIESQLAFLKSQISPHFLFNTLNFLYAQVYPHSRPASTGILLLSDIMRYALQEEGNSKVMLTQEVHHLHNYISLNQLRFNNELQIIFEEMGNFQFSLILPLVLITFVENCFKHGELTNAADPLCISLAVSHNQLRFHTYNRKRHGPKERTSGIGLANTRRRLALAYPDRHELLLRDEPDYYSCTLTIDL